MFGNRFPNPKSSLIMCLHFLFKAKNERALRRAGKGFMKLHTSLRSDNPQELLHQQFFFFPIHLINRQITALLAHQIHFFSRFLPVTWVTFPKRCACNLEYLSHNLVFHASTLWSTKSHGKTLLSKFKNEVARRCSYTYIFFHLKREYFLALDIIHLEIFLLPCLHLIFY